MGHQFSHRRLEVVVAYHPAGYTASARCNPVLVQDNDRNLLAKSRMSLTQVPSCRKAVNASSDDDEIR